MRNVFLIAYDVANDKRRTRLHKTLKGYGKALQYSLFQCRLSPSERLTLRAETWELIDHSTDRILLIDLGPVDGRGLVSMESWGQPLVDPAAHDGILIV